MRIGWFTTLKSSVLSLILHIVIGALLILSFDSSPKPKNQARKNEDTVKAFAVDKKKIEIELAKIEKIEKDKRKKEKKRLDDLNKKTRNLEKKLKAEEKKLADTKKLKELEQKKLKREKAQIKKLEKEKKELEEKRKLEEKKIKEAKQKKKDAAEKKRREEELADALEKEEAEQAKREQILTNSIVRKIKRKITDNFNTTGLPSGLQCKLLIYLVPGGEIINVNIARSSGDDIFDRRAVTAAQKASPLPVPDDVTTFEKLGFRKIKMNFKPEN